MPYSAVDSYEAVILGRREAELLGCRPGSCAFSVQRRTRTEAGVVYEFTQSLIRGRPREAGHITCTRTACPSPAAWTARPAPAAASEFDMRQVPGARPGDHMFPCAGSM